MQPKFRDHTTQCASNSLKTTSNKIIKKKVDAAGDFLVIKLLIELQKFPEVHRKIIQK